MIDSVPKYALIKGQEVVLVETINHAFSSESICVFEHHDGIRQFVQKSEWLKGAGEFSDYAKTKSIVTSESPTREKIALFRSLFRGREDVYAHGFVKKDGGIGYSPACEHERTPNCPRWTKTNPGIKCANCPCRNLIPINERALLEHFKGKRDDYRDVMGLYVLDTNCKTQVLIADFDKNNWRAETALYRNACRSLGLFPAVERSRSGNGAHVWLFFEEPIEAELARNLGCALITRAMSQAEGMQFESYDRLFPTQSTIAQGGFGNLIALPFQGKAQRLSNSVFVDDSFSAYADQWRFLSSVSKISSQRAMAIVESSPCGPLGQLAFGTSRHPIEADAVHPLQATSNNAEVSIFPKSLSVTKANMLVVKKDGLSQAAQNKIRRLAAFGNPEFYKAQAMHRSVHGIPRIIWCGDEDDRNIMLPRGCEQKLVKLALEQGCTCLFDNQRNSGVPIRAEFIGILRERQKHAADALLRHEDGILMAPTGFGKTVIGAYLIGTLKMRTLIIVPKTNLIEQWKERLEQFLKIEDTRPVLLTKSGKPSKKKRPLIGQIGGGKNAPSEIVDIATFQSLSAKDDLGVLQAKPIVKNYELVLCDECHYGAAPNLELVMRSVNARRIYGLSATPKRSDGLEGIIYMHCGPIRHKVDPKEQAAEQGFKRILRPRFTHIRIPRLEQGTSFNQIVDRLCGHNARNALIINDAIEAIASGRTPLIISQRKEHAKILADSITNHGIRTFLLTGSGTIREKRERIEQVHNTSCKNYAIVATGSYVGEGFDLPQLDALLLACPYSWEGIITQYSGRLHRSSENKRSVVVYDYVDTSIPMLERMYKRRLRAYAKLGYEVADEREPQEPRAQIVGARTWRETLVSDLSHTCKTAMISAPYMNPKLVDSIEPDLSKAISRGIDIIVVLRKAESDSSIALQADIVKKLSDIGCSVSIHDNPLSGIAIFDSFIIWYGAIPLLAFPKPDDCSLRAHSAEVAADLEEALTASLSPSPR